MGSRHERDSQIAFLNNILYKDILDIVSSYDYYIFYGEEVLRLDFSIDGHNNEGLEGIKMFQISNDKFLYVSDFLELGII